MLRPARRRRGPEREGGEESEEETHDDDDDDSDDETDIETWDHRIGSGVLTKFKAWCKKSLPTFISNN